MYLDNFEFEKVEGGYSLVKFTGYNEKNVVIPAEFKGEPVVVIGTKSYTSNLINNRPLVEILTIPDTVRKIEINAFKNCRKLKKVILPKGLIHISHAAFSHCFDLKDIVFPDSLEEIGRFAFWNCNKLEDINIPASVKKIGDCAFFDCDLLRKVTCDAVDIKCHKRAFLSCKNLEYTPFILWKQLSIFHTKKENLLNYLVTNWYDLDDMEKKDIISFLKKSKILKEYLFTQSDAIIESFQLTEKVTLTLDELTNFLEISIEKNKNIVTDHSLEYKDKNIVTDIPLEYKDNNIVTDLSLEYKDNNIVTDISLEYKDNNFNNAQIEPIKENKDLVEINLQLPTLKQFKEKWECFNVNGGLAVSGYKGNETHETIPSELAEGIKIVELRKLKSGKNTTIPTGSLTHLTIEAPITYLTQNAFKSSQLESIILPDTLENFGDFVFYNCNKLKNIVLPLNLKILSKFMFFSCNSLEEVNLPENLVEIKDFAFFKCEQLKIVNFPKHQILTGNRPFVNCKNLANEDGFVILQNVLHQYFGFDDVIIIPDYVNKISVYAFKSYKFKEVVIPESVKIINHHTFAFNEQLEKVTFLGNIQEIGDYAFAATPLLNTVTLPHGVVLGKCAFSENVDIIFV